ncbi:RNA methyltransferase [Paenibacillus sp. 481]|nr:RNA methyltransferase [Paenibacillus sp. 481]
MNKDNIITSVQNSRVKQWAQLQERKHRKRERRFLVEGTHLVLEAMKSGARVECVAYDEAVGLPQELLPHADSDSGRFIEWIGVTDAIIRKCCDTETPQPVFAVVGMLDSETEALFTKGDGLVVVVDGVQDPGNLGTIIRTADAVGASGVVVGKGSVDVYNAKTVRSTMGSMFHLPVVEGDLAELLPQAKATGARVVSTSLQATSSCYEYDFRQATWLVVGNEGQGVSPAVQALVDEAVIIPMQGQAESLNVAMATTVLLYEAMRQRLYA